MSQPAVIVDHVWKRYHKRFGTSTLWSLFGRRERTDDEFWALRDISLEVSSGECLGIIGPNGSGKSTLLKILSRITKATRGGVQVRGRVASMLEVGTGFHPELTGRENVYLSGTIMGMKREEIRRRFDEIVAFSGVEEFIDVPVKRYSSGMYVRLAFAVSAHVETDILIVDEVLAVGDAEFQMKCQGKMSQGPHAGKTILFVSHNLSAVAVLCGRCLVLEKGRMSCLAPTAEAIGHYQNSFFAPSTAATVDLRTATHYGSGRARFLSLRLAPFAADGNPVPVLQPAGRLAIELDVVSFQGVDRVNVAVTVYDGAGYRVIDANTALQGEFLALPAGEAATVRFELQDLLLKPGTYSVGLWLGRGAVEEVDSVPSAGSFAVVADFAAVRHDETFPGVYQCRFRQEIRRTGVAEVQEPGILSAKGSTS
jgi:lipopolysaccharide transport system ATP-binding protein